MDFFGRKLGDRAFVLLLWEGVLDACVCVVASRNISLLLHVVGDRRL